MVRFASMTARETAATIAVVDRFNDAFNRHDVDAVMALMTVDCVFETPRRHRTAIATKARRPSAPPGPRSSELATGRLHG